MYTYIYGTYHSRKQRHLRYFSELPPFYQLKTNTVDVTGGEPIAVLFQSISDVSAINPLVTHPFTTSMEEREKCYSFILSRTPHETIFIYQNNSKKTIKEYKEYYWQKKY
jgi:hypothetical protein